MANPITVSYRQSVLNDFSAVVKAVVFILHASPGTGIGPQFSYAVKEILPLQINPSGITHIRSSRRSLDIPIKPLGGQKGVEWKGRRSHDEDDDLEIDLIFDIYDEYQALTMHGTAPISLSLADEGTVIIQKLFKYANNGSYHAFFNWGDMAQLGPIRSVSMEYKCFSPYGEPLKGSGKLVISKQLEPSEVGTIASKIISAYMKASTVLTVAEKVAEQAAILALPNLLRANR
jgi:hypothetical protein